MELFLSEPRNRHVFSGLRVPFARCSRPRHFGATALDRRVAKTFARYATPALERPARVLTWAADEHILGVIAGGLWLAARAGTERERHQTDHLVLDRGDNGHHASSAEAADRPETAAMGRDGAYPVRASPTMLFRLAMPCM